ncbi:MAG: ABC transporter substrate-binding protein [Pseudomonadota bacterium]|nr:ABC transporter substrate-binding protein [Pseudomonadota bacterium]
MAFGNLTALTASLLALATAPVQAQPAQPAVQQGVSATEIVLGTIQDLSGPLAGYGKQARMGMQMRVDEANAAGGVHGRKLALRVEDSGYEPRRAVLAAQKLVNQNKIFAMIGHLGTAQNVASFPVLFDKNVVSFMPLTAAREMYEPTHRLKYAMLATYYDQMHSVLPRMVKEKNAQKVCAIYQDDEFGLEVLRGAEAAMKDMGSALAEKTSFKRGATDFSSQVARMRAAGCDLVVLGTIIRETIGTIAEARKIGFAPTFLGSAAAYSDLIHKLGGKPMDGLYATMTVQNPYVDDASPALREWAGKYQAQFKEEPAVFSAYGYAVIDLFVKGAEKAGPQLTTDRFIAAMDTFSAPSDIFGSPPVNFTAQKRIGSTTSRLSQIQNGRWVPVSDYIKP